MEKPALDLLKLRSNYLKLVEYEGGCYVVMDDPCRHLQGDRSCGVYGDRPVFCRRFPGASDAGLLECVLPGCTVRWVEAEDCFAGVNK